jgi:glutathione S-transferase
MDEAKKTGLTLYTAATPNGYKASVTLEELGLPYETRAISMSQGEQKKDWFLRINPNGRIPAMLDHDAGDVRVFETGAIMLYLCEHYDPEHKLLPTDRKKKAEAMSWLMWQMGGLGPMQGQANHFTRYAPQKVDYGINRYTNETRRLLQVLDTALEGKRFLVGDAFSIADIASFCWVIFAPWSIDGFTYEGLPNLEAWVDRINARPAVQRGLAVPEKSKMQEALKDPELMQKMVESASKMMVSTEKQ